MPDDHEGDLPAGDLSAWLGQLAAARRGDADSEVPCDGCTACCTASQFILVEPDEADALAHIPAALLFPAPGRPAGHRLLGYDEHGRCPMFVDGRCSIYEHRPRACRAYDCRIFAATGVDPGDEGIAVRVRRWRFDGDPDGTALASLRQAAAAADPSLPPVGRALAALPR